jgi:hypothetical protein
MADLITREQCASDHKGDSFMEAPHQYSRRKQQPRLNCPISAASSVADDNFFSNLLVEGEDEDYMVTNSDSGSGLESEGDEVEITNEEAHTIFILLIAFTNYNHFQLADSLPRKIITEKTHTKKLKLKKRKAQSGSLSISDSSKKAHVEEVEDRGEPSSQAQLSKVCHIDCHYFEAHTFLDKRPQNLGS